MSTGILSELEALVAKLPARVWYLTSNGVDMWCRRPYGFFFSTSDAAERFALAMQVAELSAIGVDARDLLRDETLAGLREMEVTRLFIDPAIDPDSGDVFGTILRLAEPN
jgi:hypothetical protein